MDYSLESFEHHFSEFGNSFDPNLHSICEEMCKKHYLTSENFCESWIAYRHSNKKHQEMNTTSLDAFDRYLSEKTSKALETPKRNRMAVNGLSSPYTPTSSKKRLRSTPEPESASKKRITGNVESMLGTPVRALPDVSTPSGKYSTRKNKGQVVTSNFDGSRNDWSRTFNETNPQIVFKDTEITLDTFKYMYLSDENKVSVLNQMITSYMENVKQMSDIPEMSDIGSIFQEPRVVVGRICVDGEKQIYLEERGSGLILPVSLTSLNEIFLFPGQIVAMVCTNNSGKCLNVLKVLESVAPAMSKYETSHGISIVVASGPFSTGDVVFEPLEDLMSYLEKQTPDICILFGPFIDCSLADEKCDEDFEGLQNKIFNSLSVLSERLNFKIIIVPSQRDLLHESVYPQPPFKKSLPNVKCLPDPFTISVDGLVIGATSTDVLFHLNKDVVSKTQMSVNRVSRLAQCLLSQQNFYPLYPPSVDVNLDLEVFHSFGKMEARPHILITPSELSCFIKTVDGTTCINPGRLAKIQAGGTFCRIFVQPDGQPGNQPGDQPLIEAEIVRI